jgi:hydroxymethylbilane synthase
MPHSRPELRIGTRGSQLALWQANAVAARIAETGGPPCRIVTIRTTGDRLQEAPLSEVGGKRLFVKEIEDALLRFDVDLAVHSSKDMPAILPEGLTIPAVLPREDPLDAIVVSGFSRTLTTIEDVVTVLGQSPVIGTGSVRRIAQLTRLFPGARFSPVRGNLDTRLRKLDDGDYHALVLAAAGLRRLGFVSRISMALPAAACVPAPGQGIVAIEIREQDDDVRRVVARIDDPWAAAALNAERALVAALGGGCQTPIGALATPVEGDVLELVAAVVSLDGSRAVRRQRRGQRTDAAALGAQVAAELIEDGAGEILADARSHQATADSRQSNVADLRAIAMTDADD